jgi:hypothetical protein
VGSLIYGLLDSAILRRQFHAPSGIDGCSRDRQAPYSMGFRVQSMTVSLAVLVGFAALIHCEGDDGLSCDELANRAGRQVLVPWTMRTGPALTIASALSLLPIHVASTVVAFG